MHQAAVILRLSLRGLRARRARSVVTALSVSVAVAGLTVFLSLGTGLRHAVEAQVDSVRPQVQVSVGGLLASAAPPPTMPESVMRQIEAQRPALPLRHVTPVFLRRQHHAGLDLMLYGVPASAGFGRVYPHARVASGRHLQPRDEGERRVVLGAQVARHLAVRVGDRARIGGIVYQVVGVLAPTRSVTDVFVIAPLSTLQETLGAPGLISLAAVEVTPGADVSRVARVLERRVDAEVYTQQQAREMIARLLRNVGALQWALSGVALLVAFLCVLTTITMSGHERRAELGVLRAVGLRPGPAVSLIVLDGLLLAVAGGAVGALAGWLASEALGFFTQARVGVRVAVTSPEVVVTVLLVSGLVGALAALPVAWSLARQSVGRALRTV